MSAADSRFTIVTPNYNTGRFLAATIESVLCNLRPGDEYYIVDGGSTDSSLEVIKRYESRLSGWSSGQDRGYADAVAKGFSQGSGGLLAWINASDLLLPGALDLARGKFDDPELDWIFGDDYHIDEAGIVQFRSFGGAGDLRKIMLYGAWTPLQDACFWRRSLYEQVGGINPLTRYAADFELFLKMALAGRSRYVPAAFSAYRRHTGQVSISGARNYQAERRAILRQVQTCERAGVLPRALYYLWARLRARVFQPLWNSRAYRGVAISELSTEGRTA